MVKRYGVAVECFEATDNRAAWVKDMRLKFGGQYYYTSMVEPGNTWYNAVDIAPYLQKETAVLKINIEGAEYVLLQYIISKGLHKNIRNLQVQFHLIEGQNCEELYSLIASALSETHELTWRYPFVWENWRRK
jgi:hypothetical protein